MSKCIISFDGGEDIYVTVEGATVAEALAMRVEYLLNVGDGSDKHQAAGTDEQTKAATIPTTPKPSGFLSKVKGG